MSLIATVKRAGHEVRCCFPEIGSIEDTLHQFPARLIACSVSTGIHNYYLKVNETVKRRHKNIISVFGGPHPTFSPDFIEQSDSIDAICRGEGDIAFVDFLDKVEKRADYHLSRNFYVRRENRIYKNELMDLIDNLDDLPYPDRENVYEAFPSARDIRIKNFMTMRGCPHNCSYCFNHQYHQLYAGKGKMLRRRSVGHVIDEIREVAARYPLELVYFRDDNFVHFPSWVEEFCHEYKSKVKLPFVCAGRLDQINEKIGSLMKMANCVSMEVGIESGNESVRNNILNRNIDSGRMIEGANILKKNRIKMLSENIIGIPKSTLENDLETYYLNKKCGVYYINSEMLQPYFGTEIYKLAKKENLLSGNISDVTQTDLLKGESILRIDHKRQRERLNKIIAFSSKLKLPVWVVKFLIYLPLKPLYSIIHVVAKGYSGRRLYPFRSSIKEKTEIFLNLLKQHQIGVSDYK